MDYKIGQFVDEVERAVMLQSNRTLTWIEHRFVMHFYALAWTVEEASAEILNQRKE